ncbi:MAG TPA: hypothetical protein VER17_12455 [Tepidisphaeraceae bacterium]|nr:hypothetical protein [Tepidisphaeraceae bacterium]
MIALQVWGRSLGPTDADRWVSLLQALLCGWVLYVNLGMLVEGVLTFRRTGISGDLAVATAAVLLYLYSLIAAVPGILTGRVWYRPLLFHAVVILLAAWSAHRWRRLSRNAA